MSERGYARVVIAVKTVSLEMRPPVSARCIAQQRPCCVPLLLEISRFVTVCHYFQILRFGHDCLKNQYLTEVSVQIATLLRDARGRALQKFQYGLKLIP